MDVAAKNPQGNPNQSSMRLVLSMLIVGVLFAVLFCLLMSIVVGFPGTRKFLLMFALAMLFGPAFTLAMRWFARQTHRNPGKYFPQVKLEPGDEVRREFPANHTQGRIAMGGKLLLTDRALRFVPHTFRQKRAKQVHIPYSDIRSVTVAPRRWSLLEIYSGAWVRRLAVETGPGTEYFVVLDPEEAVRQVSGFLPRPEGNGSLGADREP